MPDSGSPSAADCRRLAERPGEVSVHASPAFTPLPWHLLLAPARVDVGRMDLCAGAGRLHLPSRGVISVAPKELAAARMAALGWGADVSPKHGMRASPAHLPVLVAQHASPEASWLPRLSPAFDYLLKRFDTG